MESAEYKLIKQLGQGTTSEVYLTLKVGTSQLFATKKIPRMIADTPLYKKYLVNEITLLGEIHHNNIIRLESVKQTENDYFIITEYVNGGNLSNCLKQYKAIHGKNSFPEEVVQHIMRQAVDAVKYLHSKKIIHRDLKLDNIMLNFSNEDDRDNLNILKAQVKIIDFGFATRLKKRNKAISVVGSPFNMDPILLKKYHNVKNYRKFGYGTEADIWSLGALCYQMLVGETAFDGFSMEDLLESIEVGNYTLPTSLSKEAVSFINGMLQYDGDKRLSAEELSKHVFLVKNIQNFGKINVDQISRNVNGDQIMINIKKNNTIWAAFNKNNEREVNNIKVNFTDYGNPNISKSYIKNTNDIDYLKINIPKMNIIDNTNNFNPIKNKINNIPNMNIIDNTNNFNPIKNKINNINNVVKINNNYPMPYNSNFKKINLRNSIGSTKNSNDANNNVRSLSNINYKRRSSFGHILGNIGNISNMRNNLTINNRRIRLNGSPGVLESVRYRNVPVYSIIINPISSNYYNGGYFSVRKNERF